MAASPKPFRISVPNSVLSDLKAQLSAALSRPLPTNLSDAGLWEGGTNPDYLKDLLTYWKDQYDWRTFEKQLNSFDMFTLESNGLEVHFIHAKSPREDAVPLLLSHGWPGSIFEFHKIIPLLTNPTSRDDPAFHVVAPSLPGFGFSEVPKNKGWGVKRIAKTFDELMRKLGYPKYVAQGGDWGGIISRCIAIGYPQSCVAVHVNMLIAGPPYRNPFRLFQIALHYFTPGWSGLSGLSGISEQEGKWVKDTLRFVVEGSGYQLIQMTRPQTLGMALDSSPVALASWITEKFYGWSDIKDGNIESRYSKDELLTNIMIYYVTRTINSSLRIYREHLPAEYAIHTNYCPTPMGVALFQKDIYKSPQSWAKHYNNIVQWTVMENGGHFAAMEEPELLVGDLRKFVKTDIVQNAVKASSKL